jgi:hypothetical protein
MDRKRSHSVVGARRELGLQRRWVLATLGWVFFLICLNLCAQKYNPFVSLKDGTIDTFSCVHPLAGSFFASQSNFNWFGCNWKVFHMEDKLDVKFKHHRYHRCYTHKCFQLLILILISTIWWLKFKYLFFSINRYSLSTMLFFPIALFILILCQREECLGVRWWLLL